MNEKNKRTLSALVVVCAVTLLAAVALLSIGVFGSGYHYENADRYTAGETEQAAAIRNLDISWLSGKVVIAYHDADTFTLRETSDRAISEDLRLRWWVDGDTLRVRFAKSGFRHGSLFGLISGQSKELTLTLPEGLELNEVKIVLASAGLSIPDLRAEKLDIDSASGGIGVTADRVGTAAIDTASGGVGFRVKTADTVRVKTASGGIAVAADKITDLKAGSASGAIAAEVTDLGDAKLDTSSGAVTVQTHAFRSLDIDSSSGSVNLHLPTEPGWTAEIDTSSGAINSSGMNLTISGSAYICGDGSARISVNTASGSVRLSPLE